MIRSIRKALAPNCSQRWLWFSILRDAASGNWNIADRWNAANRALYRRFAVMRMDCNVCSARGPLFYDMPGLRLRRDHEIGLLRETLNCHACGATLRHRTLASALLSKVAQLTGATFTDLRSFRSSDVAIDILDTDCFSPLHRILKGRRGYISTMFDPSDKFGREVEPGIYNNDLQAMLFDDAAFDIVMTSDVMEHVADDDRAHNEINRVLKPLGAYIFTVPYNPERQFNRVLAAVYDGETVFFEPPHYHGDPLTGGILAYRVYGRELLQSLEARDMRVTYQLLDAPTAGIFRGDILVAEKSGADQRAQAPAFESAKCES